MIVLITMILVFSLILAAMITRIKQLELSIELHHKRLESLEIGTHRLYIDLGKTKEDLDLPKHKIVGVSTDEIERGIRTYHGGTNPND